MARGVLAVIVGLVGLFVMVLGWHAAAAKFILEEGATEAPTWWVALDLVVGFVMAVVGGLVAAIIAASPTRRPVKVLAGIVLVVGLLEAVLFLVIPEQMAEMVTREQAAAGEAASTAQVLPPTWYSFTIPIVGCVGVLVGGRIKGPRAAAG